MNKKRLIPILLLKGGRLVKTKNFKNPNYIGDPINTVKIFSELGANEITLLDIEVSKEEKEIDFQLLKKISQNSFVPLIYGGGIKSLDDAKKIFSLGFEKIAINSILRSSPNLITQIANLYGSQAITCSVDFIKIRENYKIWDYSKNTILVDDIIFYTKNLENIGAGEILLTDVSREGSWVGLDVDFFKTIGSEISIPLISHGGVGSINHIYDALSMQEISGVGLGSFVFYKSMHQGVVINYPLLFGI
jgi:cyclase